MEETPNSGEGWYNMEEGRAYDTDNNSPVPSLGENVTAGPNYELALTGLDGEEPIWVKPLMVSIPAASEGEDFFFNDNESRSQKQQSSWVMKRFNGFGKYMGVRTDGFEEAIIELMSAMEVKVEDDL